jgi:prolyl-tRNA synthetase
MRLSKMIGERYKERPSDCTAESHAVLVRGGYIKFVSNGIYSQYPIMFRISKKIEQIIREEMDRIDGQEVLMPVILPASLWKESGRFDNAGKELLRIKDRSDSDMVLAMAHEEAVVHLVRDVAKSYTKYPFMIFQFQTKFRDEPRARGGLIRVREFIMKDAYSFHASQEDLEEYYEKCYKAYQRIFQRVGIPDVIAVKSDSGMMGGNIAHEFMLLTDIGEDSIAICKNCDYRANVDVADCVYDHIKSDQLSDQLKDKELVSTPNCFSIEDIVKYLGVDITNTIKAVVYQKNKDDSYVIIFIRGDLEVNEAKLRNHLEEEVYPAAIIGDSGLVAGSIGPFGLNRDKFTVIFDLSLSNARNMVCGANKEGYHYINANLEELNDIQFVDVAKSFNGAKCPYCGNNSIVISGGIEVGNMFQLGTKYTETMNMRYTDANGQLQVPLMGCYGIETGRLIASICEVKHDEYGPVWPISIAPWHIHICAIRYDDPAVKEVAEDLYLELINMGQEVIIDDREAGAGVIFADADLLGVPIRVTVSPRNLKENVIEISTRDKSYFEKVCKDQVIEKIITLKEKLFNNIG